jgi:quercetin dioxygenase-like cupin family protein
MKGTRSGKLAAGTLSAMLLLWVLAPQVSHCANGADESYIRIKTKEASLVIVQGEVQVTYESGETKTFKEGDEIPPLPDGAILSVLSGAAKLEAGNTIVEFAEGDSVLLFVDDTYRTTSVQLPSDYPGQLVVTSGGATQTLSAGETYWAPSKGTATIPKTDAGAKSAKTDDAAGKPKGFDDYVDSIEDEGVIGEDRLPNPPDPADRRPGSDSGQ